MSLGARGGLLVIVTQALTRVRTVAMVNTRARVPGHVTPTATRDILPHPDHRALGVQHPRAVGGYHHHHRNVNLDRQFKNAPSM